MTVSFVITKGRWAEFPNTMPKKFQGGMLDFENFGLLLLAF